MGRYLAGDHHPQFALAERVIYVAEDSEGVIGFVAGHLTKRFECDGELQWIYVLPAWRSTGVASGLLRRLAEWFLQKNACRICVNAERENATARRFYERHGAENLNEHWLVWPDIRTATETER
jgi:GNAT superfamily N-acetyltransferase